MTLPLVGRVLGSLRAVLERRLLGVSSEEIRYTIDDVRAEIRATRAELLAEIATLRAELERLAAEVPHRDGAGDPDDAGEPIAHA